MRSGYTILEHPADFGIEACGATLGEAFVRAAEGLMSIIVEPSSVEIRDSRELRVQSTDVEQLVVRWLSEIVFLYDGKRFVGKEFVVKEITDTALCAAVNGECFDARRHVTCLDVKAITYHQIRVAQQDDGFLVRVYVDI